MKNPFARQINYSALDEAELVALAKTDRDAFGELYERYLDKMYSYVYYRTGNSHDTEDLTAKVFLRAFARIGKYVDRGLPFQAWLYRIAHNLVANWYRDQSRRKIIALEDYLGQDLLSDAPDARAERRDEHDELLRAVRRLPAERQQLLILKVVEGLPNREIGIIMGRSEGAIKSLYHRTLLALRAELSAEQANTNVKRTSG
ncbi:MAG: sigma-70 family RNA polymerase sigma factor [Chloroflexi bacterium]|nr:sigma-70 family RNA polymerase sigma factor [Chloroflexota bacterium]